MRPFFFNPTIEVMTVSPSPWMVHTGYVFVAGFHMCRIWMSGSFESVRWNACVHRLDLVLFSHPKDFMGECSQNPC